MLKSGWLWATHEVEREETHAQRVPEGIDYVPLVIGGAP